MRWLGLCAGALAVTLSACAPTPQRAGIPTQWSPSPNFDQRRANFVVIHHTSNDDGWRALRTLSDPSLKVSAHYLIARDGAIHQLVDEAARAWHAGASYWGGVSDLNSVSLGIELDNNGEEPFAEPQIAALLELLADIRQRHGIPRPNFLGHADVAPGRKVDPSRHFPWKRLAERGFGLWCDPPFVEPPPAFDAALGLQALGYGVIDLEAAVGAFKLHYVQDGSAPVLSTDDRARLYCLVSNKAWSRQPAAGAPGP